MKRTRTSTWKLPPPIKWPSKPKEDVAEEEKPEPSYDDLPDDEGVAKPDTRDFQEALKTWGEGLPKLKLNKKKNPWKTPRKTKKTVKPKVSSTKSKKAKPDKDEAASPAVKPFDPFDL